MLEAQKPLVLRQRLDNPIVGFATESVDNSGGAAGDKSCEVLARAFLTSDDGADLYRYLNQRS